MLLTTARQVSAEKLADHSQRAVDAEPDRVRQLVLRVDEDVAGPLLQGVVDDLERSFP